MNIRKSLLLSAVAVAFAAPGLSFASSLWHSADGEKGETFHPDHLKSTKTRAEVMQELEAARKDGSLLFISERGLPGPTKTVELGKPRAQVQKEQFTMSAEDKERERVRQLYGRP